MKLNRLETHDRLLHLKQDQAINLSQGAEDCLKINDLSIRLQQHSPYIYLFAHPRTADDGVTKRMIWQPRLGKPKSQTNSYLFRAQSHSDVIEICWLIPPKETWKQYQKGNVTEHELVLWSIDMYVNHKKMLDESPPEDMSDEQIKNIYLTIGKDMDEEKRIKKIYDTKNVEMDFIQRPIT